MEVRFWSQMCISVNAICNNQLLELGGIWYFGIDCWKLRPVTMFRRYNDQQWQDFVGRTIKQWGPPPHLDAD